MGRLVFLLLSMLCALGASPAYAQADAARCSAPMPQGVELAAFLDSGPRWNCPAPEGRRMYEKRVLRFAVSKTESPKLFASRIDNFGTLLLAAETADGGLIQKRYTLADGTPAGPERQFTLPLPRTQGQVTAYYAVFDGRAQAAAVDNARLVRAPPHDWPVLVLVAIFFGMLLMPLLFDVVFYRALREKFILWHMMLVAAILLQIGTDGLQQAFFDVDPVTLRVLGVTSFTLMVGAALMFAASFIEADRLDPRIRKVVLIYFAVFAASAVAHALPLHPLSPLASDAYFAMGLPGVAIALWMLVDAFRRGSRAVRFVAAGWVLLLLVASIRVVSYFVPGQAMIDAMLLLNLGYVLESAATALGVTDRFMAIRRERDRALSEARSLEELADRDPLTGLLNRRGVEGRFERLRAEGFDTLALLDLDRFKDFNDRFGHQVGDDVLVAAAHALRNDADRDRIAIRMGGEEFMLLLRGANALDRAEAARQSISRAAAHEVEGLDRPVTASMGVVEIPRAMEGFSFAELYARADLLLYEAKRAGRNRTSSEKLTLFAKRASDKVRPRAA